MHWINWAIVIGWLVFVFVDGLRRSHGTTKLDGYFLGNRSLPWWAVGLSVMATQLSAVTMIGTTGQGATDGMRFVQFYFGLPVAMLILGVTIVPFLMRAKVYTAYEFLERRFDAKTRSLAAFLFLLSRGLSCGTIIAAPAVVFSTLFGWSMWASVAFIGVPTVVYTMIGGVQAVAWADVKQMVLVVSALVAVVVVLLTRLPVSPVDALRIAGASGRLQVFDFHFSLTNTYTFWSGVIGGTFLMLSYFGTDQSQVQRYLTAKSVDEARSSHLISAYWKIPLQALVLLVGVLVFVYYLFVAPPLYWNPAQDRAVRAAAPDAYVQLEQRQSASWIYRAQAMESFRAAPADRATGPLHRLQAAQQEDDRIHADALAAAGKATGQPTKDVNYIIPYFVLHELPIGLTGVFIAAVIAAAMSAVAGELASLSSATVIDFYKRWVRAEATDTHYLRVSRVATAGWGTFACVVATFAVSLGSLIEVVNRFGSFFYGSILGVFFLAMLRRATAAGAFFGMLAGMAAVAAVSFGAPEVSFLWHNVVGVVAVMVVGLAISALRPAPAAVGA
ncbi:MAG: sodium:solute symporter [Gemmatimonadetes bacterium]|nr:sodium:solute symporter [Gemmatimonadota bacterium]MBI3569444.1 sodium:solute symporter [Gemmatimonadota bacterium]